MLLILPTIETITNVIPIRISILFATPNPQQETIQIKDGVIFINDKEIKDRSGLGEIEEAGLAKEPVTLSNDEYFVIGDNRKESIDSRSNEVGNVRRKDILGKASFIFWPFDRVGIIK